MGVINLEKEIGKDNEEFLLSRRKFLLSSIAAMGLASMTPIVSIARAASPEESKGLVISTIIEDVKTIDKGTYKVVYVSNITKINNKNGEAKLVKNSTYVIRGLSNRVFEPLVSITYGDKASIFAYADDDEFITDNVSEWDDLPILKEVIGKARAKGLKKLERFATLIERAVIESETSL
jgi:hypothetical protein